VWVSLKVIFSSATRHPRAARDQHADGVRSVVVGALHLTFTRASRSKLASSRTGVLP
jgi:hypothetical protein